MKMIHGLILFIGLAVGGCAMLRPQSTDTTAWASGQDCIFTEQCKVGDRSRWDALLIAQEAVCPTNLTLRERLIRGDVSMAVKEWREMVDAGRGYWVEGPSYAEYTFTGIRWFNAHHWPPLVAQADMDSITARYSRLRAPDGSLPLPEGR